MCPSCKLGYFIYDSEVPVFKNFTIQDLQLFSSLLYIDILKPLR